MAGVTYDASFAEWRRILKPFGAKSEEIPYLNGHVAKLASLLAQVEEIEGRQAALAAAKQEMSVQLKGLVIEGRRAAAFLKAGLRDYYGRGGEKLTEYGLQPFRGNKPAKPEEEESAELNSLASSETNPTS